MHILVPLQVGVVVLLVAEDPAGIVAGVRATYEAILVPVSIKISISKYIIFFIFKTFTNITMTG